MESQLTDSSQTARCSEMTGREGRARREGAEGSLRMLAGLRLLEALNPPPNSE